MGKKWNRSKCNQFLEKTFRTLARPKNPEGSSPKNFVDDTYRRFIEGAYKDRRKRALMNYCDRIMKEFPKGFSKNAAKERSDVYEEFVNTELLPSRNYNLMDYCGALRVAAAMWMLEQISAAGKLQEALAYLPDPDKVLPDEERIYNVSHPAFPSELVESMTLAITLRYMRGDEELKDYHLGNCVITEHMVNGRKLRDDYQKLLALLPKDQVLKSCKLFKRKVWECVDLSLRCQELMAEKIADHIKTVIPKVRQLETSFKGLSGRIQAPLGPVSSVQGLDNVKPKQFSPTNIFSGMFAPGSDDTVLESLRVVKVGSDLQDMFSEVVCNFDLLLSADKEQLLTKGLDEPLAERLHAFHATDLFGLCFALFYLVDMDDDMPWLMYSGGMLMSYVYDRLPWYSEKSDGNEIKFIYGKLEEETEKLSITHTEEDETKGSYDYYEKEKGLSMAQVLYRTTGTAIPVGHPWTVADIRYFSGGDYDENTVRHLAGMAGLMNMQRFYHEEVPLQALPFQTGPEKTEPVEPAGDKVKALEETVNALRADNARLTDENKRLQDTADWMRRNVDKTVNEFEKALEDSEKYRRELADLRELFFNTENGTAPENGDGPQDDEKPSYPYKPAKKMVVFGGHDSWLKVMRQNFPDVRFMDEKNISFSPDVIKNSDIVWVQNNSMCHSQFWNVVRYVGLYNKQMRYFTSAGTDRCSRQMVEADNAG